MNSTIIVAFYFSLLPLFTFQIKLCPLKLSMKGKINFDVSKILVIMTRRKINELEACDAISMKNLPRHDNRVKKTLVSFGLAMGRA